ncbi:MAG: MFS transporter [Acidobacteria bacterium]|nr:MFS transporter [Acidobacteriota bacterium]
MSQPNAPAVNAESVPVSPLAVACACLLMFAALVDSQVVGAIAPQVAAGLGAAKTTVAASVTICSAAAACVALLLGRTGRRGPGARPAAWLPLAAGLFVAGEALAAFAPRVAVFWAGRALAGLAGGLVSALVIAALADASSYARRGRQMSAVAVCYFLAPVAGVPVAAWLTGRAGWRAVFAAVALLVALAGLLVRLFPLARSVGDGRAAKLSDEGGATQGGARAGDGDEARPVGGARPVDDESAAPRRVSLWRLFMRTRSTRRGVVSAFFVSGGLVCLTTYLGTWLSDAFGAGAGDVAGVYAVAGAGAVLGGALGGVAADRFGKRRVAVVSSLWLVPLVLLLPTFAWGPRLWAVVCATAFAAALRVAPLQALITEVVEPAERARYVALRNAASQIGIAAAVALGGRAYRGWGLFGTALLAALLTLGAYFSARKMDDPHARGAARDADLKGAGGGRDATAAGVDAGGRDSPAARPRGRGSRAARKAATAALGVVLLFVFGLPWLLSFAITKAGTRPDEKVRTDTPAAHGASFEDAAFASSDGVRLSGWYLPSRGRGLTLVITHGLFRSRYEQLERGLALWREGYGVLLYDLRRHGRSGGEFSSVGYYERRDVEAAFRYARAREPENRVALVGLSMGAAATLLAAAEIADDKLLAVVAESSFLSFADTARHHVSLTPLPTFPFAPLLIKFTAWRLNFDPGDFDVRRAVSRLDRPVLFVGAGADRRMPTATVLDPLFAAAPHPLKRKLVVAGATHGHAYDASPGEYVRAVTEFLREAEGFARGG